MSKHWEPCPRCGSKRVQVQGRLFWFILLFFTGGFLTLFGLFVPPLLIIGVPTAVISPVGLLIPTINSCRDCKKSWRPNKKKYEAST